MPSLNLLVLNGIESENMAHWNWKLREVCLMEDLYKTVDKVQGNQQGLEGAGE